MPNTHFFESIINHIRSIISGRYRSFFGEKILYAFSLAYTAGLAIRAFLYRKNILTSCRLPCFVISVGNITAGGTGKTPMTIYLAKLLRSMGYCTVILSRGYRGKYMKKGGIVSDGNSVLTEPDDSGDEPYMMALALGNVPVLVGRNRCKSAGLAMQMFHPDIILLDDGFQHMKLKRNLDLVLLDCQKPLGNGHVLPRGMLREPVSALKRGHCFILTRCESDSPGRNTVLSDICGRMPVFRTCHIPYIHHITDEHGQKLSPPDGQEKWEISVLKNRRVFAFSGIARNDLFVRTVENLGCTVAGSMAFPDHHPYSAADMQEIRRLAGEKNAELMVTTEKDSVRIPRVPLSADMEFSAGMAVIGIEISFGDEANAFAAFIRERVIPIRH
ncbi:MAG: tetraacyldisaccharide 4'-kinase [Desulfococcaceae bacterium]